MPNYVFFREDLTELRSRCADLVEQGRTIRRELGASGRADSASSQDGSAQRLVSEDGNIAGSQLREMQEWMIGAEIFTPLPFDGTVKMGVLINVKDVISEECTWYLVAGFWFPREGAGTREDPRKISYLSRFVRAMRGKKQNQTFQVDAAQKLTTYVVMEVLPGPV